MINVIISKTNETFIFIKDVLKTNKYPDYTFTDDIQVLSNALKYNLEIKTLLYSYEEEFKDSTKELLNMLKDKAINVFEASNKTVESLLSKENHAKIIAIIKINKFDLDYFKNLDYIFVLDRLEIPGNLGTIYRTLDSTKCSGVIIVDEITRLSNYKVTSSSRGTNLLIPTISLSYTEANKFLEDNSFRIMLGEPELGLNYKEIGYDGKIAIVVGNERFGINNDWYNHKHERVFIPMDGNNNSLNVGVAASILAYEAYMNKIYKK